MVKKNRTKVRINQRRSKSKPLTGQARKEIFSRRLLGPVLLITLLLSACSVPAIWTQFGAGSYSTAGEQIYFSGLGSDGQPIAYSGGPFGDMMGRQQLSCATCHGADGKGGQVMMHMQVIRAPDITIGSQGGEHADGADSGGGHEHGEGEYDIDTFRQAVVGGQHPDGEPLDSAMPRWRVTDSDLAALFDFLKSLP